MRVLLAEDDRGWRDQCVWNLERAGFEVLAVPSGDLAVEAVRIGENFDAAVLDVLMDGLLSGIDAMIQIRELDPALPVIVWTVSESKGYPAMAALAGACRFYRKDEKVATLDFLPDAVREIIADTPATSGPIQFAKLHEMAERETILDALRRHDFNTTRAAEALGMPRTTLATKIRAHYIAMPGGMLKKLLGP